MSAAPKNANHRGDARISERRLRAATPDAIAETTDIERLTANLTKLARRPKEAYPGERRELAAFLADALVKHSVHPGDTTELPDIARAALVLNDLRLMRAAAAALVRDDAHCIAAGNLADENAGRL